MTDITEQLNSLAKVSENYFLSKLTTFKIGGPAKYLIEVKDTSNLSAIFKILKDSNISHYILGGGANVLASDEGFQGAIIKIVSKEWSLIKESENDVLVQVDAGLDWDDFVALTVDNNWWGAENMSYIPGSVGGAVAVSAGAYGQQVSDFVRKVNVYDIANDEYISFTPEQCEFKYRSTIFNSSKENQYIILSVNFELNKAGKANINYPDLIKYFADKNIANPNISEIREALHYIRFNKLPDYNTIGSAGSFFRNVYLPKDEMQMFMDRVAKHFGNDLKDEAEIICNKFSGEEGCKIPTGFILDKLLDLKGKEMGGAKVYDKQALVIINNNNATAKDVIMLVSYIKQQVRDKLNIQLQEEVKYLGF